MPRSHGASSSKKIAIYAIIGILAVAAVSASMLARGTQPPTPDTNKASQDAAMLQSFKEWFCGINPKPNSNDYVHEFVLPSDCEMPLGVTVDNDNHVWYVSTKQGKLGSYNIADNKFEKEYTIPSWPTRSQNFASTSSASMSWIVKTDGSGNIWFTDEKNNAIWRFNKSTEIFDMFKVPAKYPASLDFDSNGNIYLLGIQSSSLYFGDVSKMKNGTSDGFTEIKLPLDGFSGIDLDLVTAGSLAIDHSKNVVWVVLLAFDQKGQLFRYDIDTKKIDAIDLPQDLKSPVGSALDGSGNLWVTDHATNVFFKYDVTNGNITKFVTSVASSKIYGGTTPPNAYTLPYWIARGSDGSLWFNEHTGNKIARFDPEKSALTEYWIPSQNNLWAQCPTKEATCGVANALQFAVGPDNQIWFTEWTENKIGQVDAEKQVPFDISAPEGITVARGNSAEIKVTVSAPANFDGKMVSAGTFAPTGTLGNSTGIFSQESVSVSAGESKQVSFTFTPDTNLKTGQYIVMLGAGNDDVSYLKAVEVNVV
jgi:virginiamycin B lyase